MPPMPTRWKWLGAGVVAFGLCQVVPVERVNPPVASDVAAPSAVQEILRGSCYDCHSHETVWPWYGYVAPASWLVAHDVHEARTELNFSTWKGYRPDERTHLLKDVLEEIDEDHMPPWYYRIFHPGARLSETQREKLRHWIRNAAG